MILRASSVIFTILEGDKAVQEIPFGFRSKLLLGFLKFVKFAEKPGKLRYEDLEESVRMAMKWGMDDYCEEIIRSNSYRYGDLEAAVSFAGARMIQIFLKS